MLKPASFRFAADDRQRSRPPSKQPHEFFVFVASFVIDVASGVEIGVDTYQTGDANETSLSFAAVLVDMLAYTASLRCVSGRYPSVRFSLLG